MLVVSKLLQRWMPDVQSVPLCPSSDAPALITEDALYAIETETVVVVGIVQTGNDLTCNGINNVNSGLECADPQSALLVFKDGEYVDVCCGVREDRG
jgi:hypothetical protein